MNTTQTTVGTLTGNPAEIAAALTAALLHASTDNQKPHLATVHLTTAENGDVTYTATDGYTLTHITHTGCTWTGPATLLTRHAATTAAKTLQDAHKAARRDIGRNTSPDALTATLTTHDDRTARLTVHVTGTTRYYADTMLTDATTDTTFPTYETLLAGTDEAPTLPTYLAPEYLVRLGKTAAALDKLTDQIVPIQITQIHNRKPMHAHITAGPITAHTITMPQRIS